MTLLAFRCTIITSRASSHNVTGLTYKLKYDASGVGNIRMSLLIEDANLSVQRGPTVSLLQQIFKYRLRDILHI